MKEKKKLKSKKSLRDKVKKHEHQEDKMLKKFERANKKFEKSIK